MEAWRARLKLAREGLLKNDDGDGVSLLRALDVM